MPFPAFNHSNPLFDEDPLQLPLIKYRLDGSVLIHGSDQADSLVGTAWADEIHGHGGNDYIEGLEGDDLLTGDDGRDTILGGMGDDAIYGGDGYDTLTGGGGRDFIDGGQGEDSLVETADADFTVVTLANRTDQAFALWTITPTSFEEDVVVNVEVLELTGGSSDNEFDLDDFFGRAVIHAEGGNDRIITGNNEDFPYSSAGNDYDDFILPGNGKDFVQVGDGRDEVVGSYGDDTILGGLSHDRLMGGFGEDLINGEHGNDTIRGEVGNNILIGGYGVISGLFDDDSLYGGIGNDLLVGDLADEVEEEDASDIIDGSYGDDIVMYAGARSDYDVRFESELRPTGKEYPAWELTGHPSRVIVENIHTEAIDVLYNIQEIWFLEQTGASQADVIAAYLGGESFESYHTGSIFGNNSIGSGWGRPEGIQHIRIEESSFAGPSEYFDATEAWV